MLKFENTEVIGREHAMHGMRNPVNNWAKIGSYIYVYNLLKSYID